MHKQPRKGTLLIAPALALLVLPTFAGASPAIETAPAVPVSYQDLDLSKQAGLATLYQRLKVASQAACGPQRSLHEAGSLQRLTENQACYEQAMERAVATINHPGLNRIHSG